MPWDALHDEIAAEFASGDELSEVTERELWRQVQNRAERLHAQTQRGGGGAALPTECARPGCAVKLTAVNTRGPVAKHCSERCKRADNRRKARARAVPSFRPDMHDALPPLPNQPPPSTGRDVQPVPQQSSHGETGDGGRAVGDHEAAGGSQPA